MPADGISLLKKESMLTFEEIISVVKSAVSMGIDKLRITGGEPLVRKGIVDLVSMLGDIKGIKDMAMTTNGVLLGSFAADLKKAGLQRVNISLDTLDPIKYRIITRGGDINKVLSGIRAALAAELYPVKLNCVVSKSSAENDAEKIREFAFRMGLQVRFIRQMDLETGDFSIVEGGEGGNCRICNRLRLTADGMVKPCLFSEQEFSVRQLGAEQALLGALNAKPLKGCMNRTGSFYGIGG
jgi:cyclic pyranopterin phosphate synthase